ncbi:MAG: class I SAM-dependent methyltransferase, partial [Oscillospiraceae bacterium]|nr:class I SAM-dependent methyltransferase [Oscillospiraceae bacterium]
AFNSAEYDEKIRQTLPYYDDFFENIFRTVRACPNHPKALLDVGCRTGKTAECVLKSFNVERFVFCDNSEEMLNIARERFYAENTEFVLADVRELAFRNEFDIVTAVQVNHYFKGAERTLAVQKCFEALKTGGMYICFENFAPYSEFGQRLYLNRWKSFQLEQDRSPAACEEHIGRYNKEYFPITLSEQLQIMRDCGFKAAEILWLSYMQAGFLGIK